VEEVSHFVSTNRSVSGMVSTTNAMVININAKCFLLPDLPHVQTAMDPDLPWGHIYLLLMQKTLRCMSGRGFFILLPSAMEVFPECFLLLDLP